MDKKGKVPTCGEMRVVPPDPNSPYSNGLSQGRQEVWDGTAWVSAQVFYTAHRFAEANKDNAGLGRLVSRD